MPKIALQVSLLASLKCSAGERKVSYRDANCKGLELEVRSTGGRTWYLTYTNKRGKRHQHRLGDASDLSLAQARSMADQCRNTVAMGGDPAEEQALLRSTPTFSLFVNEQYLPFIETYKRSWKCDLSTLRVHLLPALGEKEMDTIKRSDIFALQQQWIREAKAPGTINKYVVLLRYIFNLAIRWEVPGVTVNPTKNIAQLQDNSARQRFLSTQEAQALINAVRHSENTVLEPIVSMLLITGARKREALDARWEDINWEQKLWTIPKTKAGKMRYVPLSDAALLLLKRCRTQSGGSDYIFANPNTDKPFKSVYYSWNRARKEAGLDDVRMHDLRHSFASFLINGRRSLYEVQQLLGHSNSSMTQRYAHLAHETLLDATNVAGGLIGKLHI